MTVRNYLAEHFPANELKGGLYFDWPAGLHFELAKGVYQFNKDGSYNEEMFELAIQQAMDVLNEVIEEEDDLFLVLNVFWESRYRKTRILSDYLHHKPLKYKATA